MNEKNNFKLNDIIIINNEKPLWLLYYLHCNLYSKHYSISRNNLNCKASLLHSKYNCYKDR